MQVREKYMKEKVKKAKVQKAVSLQSFAIENIKKTEKEKGKKNSAKVNRPRQKMIGIVMRSIDFGPVPWTPSAPKLDCSPGSQKPPSL
jgi:hypothetical protein